MNENPSYVRAIRGPVLLITLGVLMLLDHLGSFAFWRTWPALLVVLGVLVLAERAVANSANGGTQNPWTQGGPRP
jgi:hypothetical protein